MSDQNAQPISQDTSLYKGQLGSGVSTNDINKVYPKIQPVIKRPQQ